MIDVHNGAKRYYNEYTVYLDMAQEYFSRAIKTGDKHGEGNALQLRQLERAALYEWCAERCKGRYVSTA